MIVPGYSVYNVAFIYFTIPSAMLSFDVIETQSVYAHFIGNSSFPYDGTEMKFHILSVMIFIGAGRVCAN